MSRQVTGKRSSRKNGDCRIRQPKPRIRQSISPVMQKVKALLPTSKAAAELHILTDQPISNCEKMLCGQRSENVEMLTALLRSDHGREVLFAIMGDARPRWFARYRKALDANALERQLADTKRMINQLREESSDEA